MVLENQSNNNNNNDANACQTENHGNVVLTNWYVAIVEVSILFSRRALFLNATFGLLPSVYVWTAAYGQLHLILAAWLEEEHHEAPNRFSQFLWLSV